MIGAPEMVERVARAMFDLNIEMLDWDRVHESVSEGYRHSTRAAIAAMREPTEGMVTAGKDAYKVTRGKRSNLHGPAGLAGKWQAMIDAALSEEGR
jgi:hypothetical protein